MHIKQTPSYCPECYRKIPADIYAEGGSVMMSKTCPEHGTTTSMVERDLQYYYRCLSAKSPMFYGGYIMDITSKCNLSCEYCYHDKKGKDPSIDSLIKDAQLYAYAGPLILSGGEPTIREDFIDVVSSLKEINQIEMVTNGTGLVNGLLDETLPLVSAIGNVVNINLSVHPEGNGIDVKLLEEIKKRELRLGSILIVIDDISQIPSAVDFASEHRDAIAAVRLKAASVIWSEDKPKNKIFVSDMLHYLQDNYETRVMWEIHRNKVSFFNIVVNGIPFMLVSWYNVHNVDLADIACPPVYMAKNGAVENLVTSMLINEGMDKGWLNGNRFVENG